MLTLLGDANFISVIWNEKLERHSRQYEKHVVILVIILF